MGFNTITITGNKKENIGRLREPKIRGPIAPTGTAESWEIQRLTIVVQKIAGNEAAIPAAIAFTAVSITATKTANAAARPLRKRVKAVTGFFPDGAGRGKHQTREIAPIANMANATSPVM